MSIAYHRFAEAFPLIDGQDFVDFTNDIREQGLRRPIDLFENAILDGRNRYRSLRVLVQTRSILGPGWGSDEGSALSSTTLEPGGSVSLFRKFSPDVDGDPLDYVASLNLRRRNLSVAQRAMVAARLGRLGWGGDRTKLSTSGLSAEKRAALVGVGRATVERAEIVVDRGISELINMVDRGRVSVVSASSVAKLPASEQQDIISKGSSAVVAHSRKANCLAARAGRNLYSDLWATIDDLIAGLEEENLFQAHLAVKKLDREIIRHMADLIDRRSQA